MGMSVSIVISLWSPSLRSLPTDHEDMFGKSSKKASDISGHPLEQFV